MISLDTETERFSPGNMAPNLVCMSAAPCARLGLWDRIDSEFVLEDFLSHGETIVGQHIAYDACVLCRAYPRLIPQIFKAYESDRVTDTKLRQQLLDTAAGELRGKFGHGGVWIKHAYDLDTLARRFLGKQLHKDGWRMVYGEFVGVPIAEWVQHARDVVQPKACALLATTLSDDDRKMWEGVAKADPEEVVTYPVDDAKTTLELAELQEVHKEFLGDQFRQARAYFALQLSSVWGLWIDQRRVELFVQEVAREHDEVRDRLQRAGIVRPDGSRDTKRAKQAMIDACAQEGIPVRLTEKGNVCMDSDACDAVDDATIQDYAAYSTLAKVESTDVPLLRRGIVHTSYGFAASGRTTSSNPNIQNLRVKKGIRELFVPRPGNVFAQADYSGLELHTLAQVCMTLFGHSVLADILNSGKDPHTVMAADILGISYDVAKARHKDKQDKEFYNARQTSKVANFGIPGGLGPDKLVLFARKQYDVILTRDEAVGLKDQYLRTLPEMQEYFAFIGSTVEEQEGIEQLYTGRYRGGCTYTAACNTLFQGLGADCAKEAAWRIAKAQYTESRSPLYGSRTVAFIHDEFVVECQESRGHVVATELSRVMVDAANMYLTHVPAKAEPCLMPCWSKEAETIYVDGRLVPWTPTG